MREWLEDESGKPSAARRLLTATLAVALLLATCDAIEPVPVAIPAAGYSLLSTVIVALIAWAGGPRVAEYVGTQLGQIAEAIASRRGGD